MSHLIRYNNVSLEGIIKKLLITVTNNLVFDSRVKRHSLFLSGFFNETVVLCSPEPNDDVYLEKEGLHQLFINKTLFDRNPMLLKRAENCGFAKELISAYPFLGFSTAFLPTDIENSLINVQEIMIDSPVFSDLSNVVCTEESIKQTLLTLNLTFSQWISMAEKALTIPADVVLCNDLDSLLSGVAHKKKFGSRLVYDAHEVYFDMAPGYRSRLYTNTMALLEMELIKYADYVIGVGYHQMNWMKSFYCFSSPYSVVPNCSQYGNLYEINTKPFPAEKVRLYYHGNCDPVRGVNRLIESLKLLDDKYSAVLRIIGDVERMNLQNLVQKLSLEGRVQWKEPVTAEEIICKCHADGDIGMIPTDKSGSQSIGQSSVLTNKFIEYITAGLPVIATDLGDQAEIIKKNHLGIVVADNSPETLLTAINELNDKEKYEFMSRQALKTANELFSWEVVSQRLIKAVGL